MGVVCVYVYKVYAEEEVVTHGGAALCAMTCAGFETGDDSIKCAAKDFADRLLSSPSPPVPTELLTKLTVHKCPTHQPDPAHQRKYILMHTCVSNSIELL